MHSCGASVVLTDIDPAALEHAVSELGAAHGVDSVRGIQGDVTSEAAASTRESTRLDNSATEPVLIQTTSFAAISRSATPSEA